MKIHSLILATFLLVSCSVQEPASSGALTGLTIGATTGALAGATSTSYSTLQGVGYGVAIGVPSGIALAYLSDSLAKLDSVNANEAYIQDNKEEIEANETKLQYEREALQRNEPQGLPDESTIQHLYTGPTLGNRYR